MLQISNHGIDGLRDDLKDRKLYIFGAGKRARFVYKQYDFQGKVTAFIDNNADREFVTFDAVKIPLWNVETFNKVVATEGIQNSVLLITPVYYSYEIVQQLDKIKELDGLKTYIEVMMSDVYKEQLIEFTNGENVIPKKIHYCWFGGKEIPDEFVRYIEGWKKLCPDYEIIRWDETNYDYKKNQYMREAYDNKKYGFVPDYARLDIIYNEGGIYLDTDVELIRKPDRLLMNDAFFGFQNEYIINMGLGFGARKGQSFVKELRDYYNGKSFYNDDGTLNLDSCFHYQNPLFVEKGFRLDNTYQLKDGIACYPSEVLAPLGSSGFCENFTENTIASHHASMSWVGDKKGGIKKVKEVLLRRNE